MTELCLLLLGFLLASPAPATQVATGDVVRVKSRTVTLQIDHRSRDFILSDRTTFVDRDDTIRAVGARVIARTLAAGTRVRITWTPYWVMDGAGIVTQFYRDAVEVRLPPD